MPCFWMNEFFEQIGGINDSVIHSLTQSHALFLNESVFEQIGGINDSVIHSLTQSHALFLNESAIWFSMTHSLTVTRCHLPAILMSLFDYFFHVLNYCKHQFSRFMLKTKDYAYLCLCNCSLNAYSSCLWIFFYYIYLLLFHFAFTCTFTFNT